MPRIESGQFRRAQFEERGEVGVFSPIPSALDAQRKVSVLTGGRARFNHQASEPRGSTSDIKNVGNKGADLAGHGKAKHDSYIVHEGYIFVRVSPSEDSTQITVGDEVLHVLRVG